MVGLALVLLVLGTPAALAATTSTHPLVSSFDGSDSTGGAFGGLGRVAVDEASGGIYAIDNVKNVVDKFDATGAAQPFTTLELPVGSTALDGSNTPDLTLNLGGDSDVTVDNSGTASDGNVYVDSEGANSVYAFDPTGSYLYTITGFGDACGVAVNSAGNLWVSDYNSFTITEYTAAGTPTGSTIDTTAVDHPCHIAFDSSDNLYVNMYQGRVEKYDALGNDLGSVDPGPAVAVAVDRSTDHAYVDHGQSITEYDETGDVVTTFGTGTIGDSSGVAVDGSTGNPSSGNVVVSDNANLAVHRFGPLVTQTLPDVTTGVVTNLGPTTARLGGLIDPSGVATTCAFEYGPSTAYGSTASCAPAPGSGSGSVVVHADLSSLTPGTTYHYRLTGTSADGTANGLDQTFTTPQAPTVGGGTATPGSTSATLKATVNPQGAATTYHFEVGATTAYGISAPVPDASAGASSSDQNVSVEVSGLQPQATYHFRVVATNVAGTTDGADHTFTTRAAGVPDTCPNAGIRQQQGSTSLLDCRAWEMVSQADKGFSRVIQVSPLAAGGDRVMYDILGGGPGTSSGARAKLVADRTANGWVSATTLPPVSQLLGQTYLFNDVSPDAGAYIASAFDGLGTTTGSPDVTIARIDAQGHQTVLHRFPQYFGSSGVDLAASDDLQHVYASVPEAIAPSHQAGTWNLYDFGSGTPALVGTMPLTGVAPTCGLENTGSFTQTGFVFGGATLPEHWTSTDGRRVFFQSRGDDAPGCSAPLELYTHDTVSGRSALVSGPPLSGDPDNGVDRFLQATPDGSVAFLRTATSLTAADDVDGNANDTDVYRWTAGGATVCITCAIPQAEVRNPTLVSEDGSHVYFASLEQFDGAPAADPSNLNTYVWRGNAIHFIGQTDGVNDLEFSTNHPAQATPDGNVLVFSADNADLNARTRSDNGGTLQYYRYDDVDGSLTCVSCPRDGSAATVPVTVPLTTSFGANHKRLRAVSDDGSTFVFRTSATLVPEDRNAGPDLYEWHDGALGLISSGTATLTDPNLVTLSSSGRDILFLESAALTADVKDSSAKLYDARVDGGFPAPASPPSPCAADQCRGPVSGPPSLADPSSDTTTGGGNVKPATPARFSVSAIGAGKRAQLARTGRMSLGVRVNRAGTVSLDARAKLGRHTRDVGHAAKRARRAGTVTLTLRLSKAARERLADAGRLRVSLVVRFSSASAGKRVTLVLKASGGGAHRAAAAALVPTTADGR